jgi:hypothetical protein
MLAYSGETDVDFALVILGTDIEAWSRLRERTEPIFSGDMSYILH